MILKVGVSIKNQCKECCRITNHSIKSLETTYFNDDNRQFESWDHFAIVQCLGCETISFRREYSDSDTFDYDEDGYPVDVSIVSIYPPLLKEHKPLSDIWALPNSIKSIYKETVVALASNCKILAGAGCRAIIEAVCIDKEIKAKNLEDKINALAKKGLITKNESNRMHSIRFLGNDSIHEMIEPKENNLRLVISIIEHLLSNLYIIDVKAKRELESIIDNYEDFESHLSNLLRNKKKGEEYSLYEILDRDFRRVKDGFVAYQQNLIANIAASKFTKLTLGTVRPKAPDNSTLVQYFIVDEDPSPSGFLYTTALPPPPVA